MRKIRIIVVVLLIIGVVVGPVRAEKELNLELEKEPKNKKEEITWSEIAPEENTAGPIITLGYGLLHDQSGKDSVGEYLIEVEDRTTLPKKLELSIIGEGNSLLKSVDFISYCKKIKKSGNNGDNLVGSGVKFVDSSGQGFNAVGIPLNLRTDRFINSRLQLFGELSLPVGVYQLSGRESSNEETSLFCGSDLDLEAKLNFLDKFLAVKVGYNNQQYQGLSGYYQGGSGFYGGVEIRSGFKFIEILAIVFQDIFKEEESQEDILKD